MDQFIAARSEDGKPEPVHAPKADPIVERDDSDAKANLDTRPDNDDATGQVPEAKDTNLAGDTMHLRFDPLARVSMRDHLAASVSRVAILIDNGGTAPCVISGAKGDPGRSRLSVPSTVDDREPPKLNGSMSPIEPWRSPLST